MGCWTDWSTFEFWLYGGCNWHELMTCGWWSFVVGLVWKCNFIWSNFHNFFNYIIIFNPTAINDIQFTKRILFYNVLFGSVVVLFLLDMVAKDPRYRPWPSYWLLVPIALSFPASLLRVPIIHFRITTWWTPRICNKIQI